MLWSSQQTEPHSAQMANEDVLQPISKQDIPNLLGVLKRDLPSSCVVYDWICTQSRWAERIPELKIKILCPRGDWSNGTLVALADGLALQDKQYGVVYAREGQDEELAAALMSTRAVPWQRVLHFGGVLERHESALRRAAEAAGVTLPQQQPPLSYLMNFPSEMAAQFEPPSAEPGIRVARLDRSHLDEIWRLRPLFPDYYKPVIGACLEHNLSAGVFMTQPDGSERLLSIAIQSEYGGLGMGQTHPDFMQRGYSSMAGLTLFKQLAQSGDSLHAWTSINHRVVVPTMQKYGVPIVGKCCRLIISPHVDVKLKSNI